MPPKLELPVLKLSPEARDLFIRFYDDIERRLLTDLSGHGDVGSKAAEQALRIAGVMTLYENPHATEVPDHIASSAIALAEYFVGQNIRLTGGGISQKRLGELKDHVANKFGDKPFYLSQAQQFWKGSRRKADVLKDLSKLVDNGYLEQLPSNRNRRRTPTVCLEGSSMTKPFTGNARPRPGSSDRQVFCSSIL